MFDITQFGVAAAIAAFITVVLFGSGCSNRGGDACLGWHPWNEQRSTQILRPAK